MQQETDSDPTSAGRPATAYIDLTGATEEAIGMTGRFLCGRWRDIVKLTLIVWACFFLAMLGLSQPTRDQMAELLDGTWVDFSVLAVAELLFTVVIAPVFSFGIFTWLTLVLARVSFARDNLYWKRRGRSRRVIGQLGITLRELWCGVHAFRKNLEQKAGSKPSRLRWLSNILLFLAGLVALSPILLAPFKDLEGPFHTNSDNFLFAAFGAGFFLYLFSRWLRVPPVADWSYRRRALTTRLKGFGIIAAFFAATGVAAHLLQTVIDSGIFPSSESSKILPGIYLLLAAVIAYGWFFALMKAIGVGGRYIMRARKIGLAQAADRVRRDPRAPITVLRSFADEKLVGALSYAQLEAEIEEAASVYGPLIAAGARGELPVGEVGRQYFADETWRDGVLDFLDRSLLILLVPATTAGVQWEVETIVSHDYAGKLVLVLMPTQDLHERQRKLAEGFAGTPWESAVAGADLTKAVAVYFRPHGKLTVLTSSNRDRPDFQLAIHCAVYGVFCSHGRG